MASLLTKWLNEEVGLSREVEDLDNDFKDGFLIGELMAKFNQQSDFENFLQTGTADAKIKNFCLLEPTMNQIGVHYNSRIAQDIMSSKPGVMKTLLYEIRTACDTMSKIVHSVGPKQKILRVIQPSRAKYDRTKSITFENAVRSMSENPNDVMMANATARFQDNKFQFQNNVSLGHTASVNDFMDSRQRFKEIQQQKKKHEREFHQAWELKNKEQWQKNQTVAHDRRKLEHKVHMHMKNKEHNVKVSTQNDARSSTLKGIDDFEMHMKNREYLSEHVESDDVNAKTSMLKVAGGADGTGVPELMYLDEQVLTANLIHAQKTIKEHHKDLLVSQKEHGRRRNKYVRGVESKRIQQLQRVVEESMMSQLLTPSRSELGDDKKRDQVVNYVNVMRDNRTHRDVLLDEVRNVDAYREAQWASEQVQREIYWTINLRMASQIHRDQMYSESMTFADRFYTVAAITEEVERILDVVDWVISVREFSIINNNNLGEDPPRLTSNERPGTAGVDEEVDGKHIVSQSIAAQVVLDEEAGSILLPQVMWRTIIAMYLSSFPIAKALTFPMPSNVYETLPYSLSHQPFCVDPKELIEDMFTGTNVFAYQGQDASKNDNDNPFFVVEKSNKSLSCYLAEAECSHGVSCLVNDFDFDGHLPLVVEPRQLEYLPPKEPYVPGDGGPEDLKAQAASKLHRNQHNKIVMTPNWVFETAPKYLFGQILLDVSCTSDPLPVAPMPAVSSRSDYTMPLRIALTGMSDVARKTTAHMLRDKYNLALINVDHLISRAMDHYRDAVDHSADIFDDYDDNMLFSEFATRNTTIPVGSTTDTATSAQNSPDYRSSAVTSPPTPGATGGMSATGDSRAPDAVTALEFAEEKERLLVSYIGKRLMGGKSLSDDVYVSLIVAKIQDSCNSSLISRSPSIESLTQMSPLELPLGFVIEDFPNTKQQALLLFEALSGFDYSKSLPQPVDRASVYAPTVPCERVDYDVSKCGLDMIYYFDTESSNNVLYERLNARQKTVPVAWDAVPTAGEPLLPHVETVYMTNQMTTTQHLEDLYTPSRPVETSSLAIHDDLKAASAYKEFLQKMRLMRHKVVNGFDEFDALAKEIVKELRDDIPKDVLHMYPEEQEVVEEVVVAAVEDEGPMLGGVMRSFSRGSVLKTVKSGQDISPPDEANTTLERPVAADHGAAHLEAVLSVSNDVGDFDGLGIESVVEEVIPDMVSIPATLPSNLAGPLAQIWQTAETQSLEVNTSFNGALRDIRFQMLQRRRCLYDGVYSFITMHDEKQNVMENFRTEFNTVDNDLRFDVACIAEFHLRVLEMKNTFWDLALERRQAADAYLSEKGHDSQIPIFIHRSYCEGAALIESELHRFYASLHILFDYMKSLIGFDYLETVHNKMEDVVEMADTGPLDGSRPSSNAESKKPAKGKLSKEKSVKVSKKDLPPAEAPPPFRIPYSTGILPSTMEQLPVGLPMGEEEAQKVPVKKPAKGKKGEKDVDVSHLNPMELAEKAAIEASAMYTSESFKVNRELYDNDEAVCTVLENVIWFETKKFRQSLANVMQVVNTQVGWLHFMEHDITKMLQKIIADQQMRELAAGERVVVLAQQSIDACEPICVEWLIAPDALAVCPNRLIIPAFVPPPPPVVEEVFDNVLNENQFDIVAKKIMSLKHHNSVLCEDFASWLQRSCNSSVSPQSCTTTSLFKSVGDSQDPAAVHATFSSTAFPINWRVNTDHCMTAMLEQHFVAGTCMYSGDMAVDVVLEKLRQYRGYEAEGTEEVEVVDGLKISDGLGSMEVDVHV